MKVMFPVEINNITYELEKYTVARYTMTKSDSVVTGSWWFFGTYSDRDTAYAAAYEVNGVVFESEV